MCNIIVGPLPDLSLDSMVDSANNAFQEFVMDPANADRPSDLSNGVVSAGITAAIGFTGRQMGYM